MLPFVIKDDNVNHTMHIEPIFSIPVGNLQVDKVLIKKILAFIKSIDIKLDRNLGGNSISIDDNFLDNDELSDVKQLLTDSVNEYFKEVVNPNKDTKLYITISWLNVSQNGESHHVHHHPNSIVSAILYIDTCEDDTVSFINQKHNIFGNLKFDKTHKTKWDTYGCNIPAMVNTLVMFPSTLPHMVTIRPNNCTGTRISLAFNTWIRGRIGGGEDSPDQLCL